MESQQTILKHYKLKVTATRLKILELLSGDCKPMNAEELAKKIKKSDVVTIYRTLQTFEKAGIVKQVDLRKGSIYYELSEHHHHHIVCTTCGLLEEFELCMVPKLSNNILKQSKKFNTISEHALELFGICKSCAKV